MINLRGFLLIQRQVSSSQNQNTPPQAFENCMASVHGLCVHDPLCPRPDAVSMNQTRPNAVSTTQCCDHGVMLCPRSSVSMALYVHDPMLCPQSDVSRCSVSTNRCVHNSLCPRPNAVSTVLCVHDSLCPRPNAVSTVLCVHGSLFPRTDVSMTLCVHEPMLSPRSSVSMTLCVHEPMCPRPARGVHIDSNHDPNPNLNPNPNSDPDPGHSGPWTQRGESSKSFFVDVACNILLSVGVALSPPPPFISPHPHQLGFNHFVFV